MARRFTGTIFERLDESSAVCSAVLQICSPDFASFGFKTCMFSSFSRKRLGEFSKDAAAGPRSRYECA